MTVSEGNQQAIGEHREQQACLMGDTVRGFLCSQGRPRTRPGLPQGIGASDVGQSVVHWLYCGCLERNPNCESSIRVVKDQVVRMSYHELTCSFTSTMHILLAVSPSLDKSRKWVVSFVFQVIVFWEL